MAEYKYQMHTHTSPASFCSRMTPSELVEALHSEGYAGCVLTNHFFRGNTGIDRNLPWKEFVASYEEDYLVCKSLGEKYGLDILFGLEEQIGEGREILLYGVTPQMLYAHPELRGADAALWYKIMHEYGALVIQAHPYRDRAYISQIGVLPQNVIDGIEVFNYGNKREDDEKAEAYARANPHLICTSGADTHQTSWVGIGGIATDTRLTDEHMLVDVLKSGKYTLLTE